MQDGYFRLALNDEKNDSYASIMFTESSSKTIEHFSKSRPDSNQMLFSWASFSIVIFLLYFARWIFYIDPSCLLFAA